MLNACSILTAKTVTGDAGSWRAIDRPSGVRFGAKSAISARRPSAGRYGGPGGFTHILAFTIAAFFSDAHSSAVQPNTTTLHSRVQTREASMGKPIVVLFSA